MIFPLIKTGTSLMVASFLAACAGGGGDDTPASVPPTPPVEVTDPDYIALDNRIVMDTQALEFVGLVAATIDDGSAGTLNYADGTISGGALDGLDIDSVAFSNPAVGEFTRVVETSNAGNRFGVIGIQTERVDRPDTGTVNYNQGWVAVTATSNSEVYTLEGQASLQANFDAGNVNATFSGFSGTNSLDQGVNNVGNLTVTGADMVGFDGAFQEGMATGTGIFAGIDPDLDDTEFFGVFFGPDADEVGGAIDVDNGPVTVTGAFQAD